MVRETGLPNMDSKDVEEIFKSVVTDESRTSNNGAGRVSPQHHSEYHYSSELIIY